MKKTADELRDLYREEYVQNFPKQDNGRLARLVPLIPIQKDDRVLDVACGNGLLLDLVHDKVDEYVGVDFSSEFIEEARARAQKNGIDNGRFECQDVIEFCEQHPKAFTKAFLLDFSEHVYDEDFLDIAKAVRNALREDGRLYLHTPNRDYILERLKHRGLLHNDPAHVAVRAAPHLCELLTQAGFRQHEVVYPRHYVPLLANFHFLSHLPLLGPKLFRARIFIASSVTK